MLRAITAGMQVITCTCELQCSVYGAMPFMHQRHHLPYRRGSRVDQNSVCCTLPNEISSQ